jgi:hypothetical protein
VLFGRGLAKNCFSEILKDEIEAFQPDIIFSFGKNACDFYQTVRNENAPHWQLNHPANRNGLRGSIAENESKIRRLLQQEGILK